MIYKTAIIFFYNIADTLCIRKAMVIFVIYYQRSLFENIAREGTHFGKVCISHRKGHTAQGIENDIAKTGCWKAVHWKKLVDISFHLYDYIPWGSCQMKENP